MTKHTDSKNIGGSPAVPQKTKVPVSIENFLVGWKVPFDVFSKEGTVFSLALRKWTRFDQELKNALSSKGITTLYVEGDPLQIKECFKGNQSTKQNENFVSYSKDKALYHHVSKLIFPLGARVNFSIFTVDNLQFKPVLFVKDNSYAAITEAVRNAPGDLAIKVSDMNLFRDYLVEASRRKASTQDNKAALQVKVAGIKENVKMNVRDFLSDPGNPQKTDGVVNSANQIVNVLRRKEAGLNDLLTLRARDFHLYNHSLNVAILSTAIAVAMDMEQSKVEKLAVGAMMHDVGKANLPPAILYKKDPLTTEEFILVKKHVNDGVSMLQNKGLSGDSLNAVQQHHERLSGSGYPFGLKGSAITPFGRIISLVNCYDALITPRPLRPVLNTFAVLDILMKETTEKGDFDPEVVKVFIDILRGQGRI